MDAEATITRPITRISPASTKSVLSMLRASASPAMRLSLTDQPPDRRRERAAAMLEVVEHVEAGAGRRQEHHVAGLGEGSRRLHRGLHVPHALHRHAARDGALDRFRIF